MQETIECDLVILGAGICGLNVAFVAAELLGPEARIVVVDRHEQAGGMWNDVYPYVRLHQPYPLFTVGDIPWTLGRERSYLPGREEVLTHLRRCLDVVSERIEVQALWEHEALGHEENADGVRVTVRDRDGTVRTLTAGRYVKALGFDIEMNEPLPLTSDAVRSASPHDLVDEGELLGDDAPIWVLGSGKTAMDTVVHLAGICPGREVNLVAGSGTYFNSRDASLPTGARRWYGGTRVNWTLIEAARRFDGRNIEELRQWAMSTTGISPLDAPVNNVLGVLSEAESQTVREAVGEVLRDHLVDVVDGEAGTPELLLRTGVRHPVAPGSWIVNCTGLLEGRDQPHEPYISSGGRVMSVNNTSNTFGFSSFSGFFLSHLFFRGVLADAPLVEFDWHQVRRHVRGATTAITASVLAHNMSVAFELGGGPRLFARCGLDFDRWYPPHRKLAGQLQFLRRHRRDRAHAARSLAVVRETYGIRCGPLERAPAQELAPRAV